MKLMEWLQIYTRTVESIACPRSVLITGSPFLLDEGGDSSGGWVIGEVTQTTLLYIAFRLYLDYYVYCWQHFHFGLTLKITVFF